MKISARKCFPGVVPEAIFGSGAIGASYRSERPLPTPLILPTWVGDFQKGAASASYPFSACPFLRPRPRCDRRCHVDRSPLAGSAPRKGRPRACPGKAMERVGGPRRPGLVDRLWHEEPRALGAPDAVSFRVLPNNLLVGHLLESVISAFEALSKTLECSGGRDETGF